MILLSHKFIYSSLISTTELFYTFFKISSMRRDKMVLSKYKWVNGINDKQIFLRFWDDVDHPIGVVQIIHGMAEHSKRYENFAHFLNRQGFIVYADDHRGHGNSLEDDEAFGYIGEDGFNNIVEDEKIISDFIKKKHKELPLYIFSHSFGSFIGQEYIIRYSNTIDGIILSGSAKQDGLDVRAGRVLASIQNKVFNDQSEAKLIDKLSFGSFNKTVDYQQTKFDWLSRDQQEVEKYIADDFCGFVSPINFYYYLFKGFKTLYQPDRLAGISKDLPILVISGDKDPVGKYGKSVKNLYQQYQDLDIKNISLKLFPNGRHELVNETNKEKIFHYIFHWLSTEASN